MEEMKTERGDGLADQWQRSDVTKEVSHMREVSHGWRRPNLAQIEGPNDLKIYGGTIADDIDRWADLLAKLNAEVLSERQALREHLKRIDFHLSDSARAYSENIARARVYIAETFKVLPPAPTTAGEPEQ